MRFQSFLSLITYLAIGIVSLTVWTKKSEARIGCSYREINNLEKMVSEETAKKYIEWVCEGKKPDMPANFGRRKSHDKSDLFFGGSGKDSFHLEWEEYFAAAPQKRSRLARGFVRTTVGGI